jgi:3-oxoacyl-[acyl-carrier-protein] synthase III
MILAATTDADHISACLHARIVAVATYCPEYVLSNEELSQILGDWSADKIFEKTGIRSRHIAAEGETALDMGCGAAEALLRSTAIDRDGIDFVIFCSQASDYILPTSACIMQNRLNLPKSVGALDINLGCSGYVYGLSLANGLIKGGMARRILLVTADTYSKFIHEQDRSVRTLFGDGATASLIDAATDEAGQGIESFIFGTDGSGANELIVETGGARVPRSPQSAIAREDSSGNWRSRDNLYMNGPAVMNFTLREVPRLFAAVKQRAGLENDDIDFLVMHQANRFMLDALVKKLGFPKEKTPYMFENIGNTVSSTIPFVLADLFKTGRITTGKKMVLLGFGVGLSWAGCVINF